MHEHYHFHGEKSQIIISTIGLVVHSFSDGFAFGSAAFSDLKGGGSSLHIVIFIALILHKGPAAIGLSTFLLHEKVK